jgi:hypothetical protein
MHNIAKSLLTILYKIWIGMHDYLGKRRSLLTHGQVQFFSFVLFETQDAITIF